MNQKIKAYSVNHTLLKKYAHLLENYTGNIISEDDFHITKSRLDYFLADNAEHNSLSHLYHKVCCPEHGDKLREKVLHSMMMHETLFFRDKEIYNFMEEKILVKLEAEKPKDEPISLWSTSCSTGQEAYSLAIMAHRFKSNHALNKDIIIDASDYNGLSVNYAEKGCYNKFEMSRGLSKEETEIYFQKTSENTWEVISEIRNNIQFFQDNLLESSTGSYKQESYDIILCRNTLMYMSSENKEKIMAILISKLKKNGLLILGASEHGSSLAADFLIRVSNFAGIYYIDSDKGTAFLEKMQPLLQTLNFQNR